MRLLLLVERAEVDAAVHECDAGEDVDQQVDDLPEADARPPPDLVDLQSAVESRVSATLSRARA